MTTFRRSVVLTLPLLKKLINVLHHRDRDHRKIEITFLRRRQFTTDLKKLLVLTLPLEKLMPK